MTRTRGIRTFAAAAAIAVALAGGCSANRDDRSKAMLGSESSASSASGDALADAAGGAATAAGSGGANAATGTPLSAIPASVALPKIVKNATVRLEVKDGTFDRSFTEAATIAGAVGGFVASSTSAAGGDDELTSGQLVMRVPAERFDEVMGRLRRLGKVRGEELRGDDVSGQLTDLEARLRNLRAQEEAIRTLMARSKDVGETLQIQNQLGGVREQIEQLDAQRARLADAVTFATVTVALNEPGAAPAGEPSPVAKAWARALDGAEAVVAGVIVAAGYLLPIAVLVVLALAAFRLAAHPRRSGPAVAASVEHGA